MRFTVKVSIIGSVVLAIATVLLLRNQGGHSSGRTDLNSIRSATAALPTLMEFGSNTCVPCRMMQPVIAALRSEAQGRLQVDHIDAWKNPDMVERYHVEVIPTQIFFDASGKERFRHIGFYAKDSILATWASLGVDLATPHTR